MRRSPYWRLNGVIDEATVLEAELEPAARTARLRLGLLLHTSSADEPQPERTFVLRDLSRAVVWLRRLRQEPGCRAGQPGPPILLRNAAEIGSWLRRWSGCNLYDQPAETFDSSNPSAWLSKPSIALTWPTETSEQHTMDLVFPDRRGPGGHTYALDLRLEFGDLDVLTRDGQPDDADALADSVRAWWHDMDAGLTGGQYGIYPVGNAVPLSA
jgi:hypothetical protein